MTKGYEATLSHIVSKYGIDLAQPSPFILAVNRQTDLPLLFRELGFTSGAEVGVLAGEYSEKLCREIPDATIYSIDPWQHYPVHKNFRPAWVYETLYQQACARLAPYDNSRIIRKTSTEASADFADGSLDFVFIDADHRFQHIANDIANWSRKVKIGGIISGHDFAPGAASKNFCHVPEVVTAWCAAYRIHPWFVLDWPLERSWLWVKMENFP
jgi:SAM-dependent methyltransferase